MRTWPVELRHFPALVVVDGREYRRARWQHRRAGVRMQYRETRPRGSAHLFVFDDFTYALDHVDRWNPDAGPVQAVLHLVGDVLAGRLPR